MMIVTLPKDSYEKINKLLVSQFEKNENVLNAVICGMNRGIIYVDQIEEPRTAIVYAVGLEYFLLGDPENEPFNRHLGHFISTQLKQDSMDLCGGTWFIGRIFDQRWKETVERVVNGRSYFVDYSVYYELDSTQINKGVKHSQQIMEDEYSIVKITEGLIHTHENLRDELTEYWSTAETFTQYGLGYAVLSNEKLISACYSCCVNGDRHEVYVATFDKKARNKGLATLLGQRYIDECLERGFSVYWTTDESNEPSKRVAEKLGFNYSHRLMSFEFEF